MMTPTSLLISSKGIEDKNRHHSLFVTVACCLAGIIHVLCIPTFWYVGVKPLAVFNIFSVILFLFAIYFSQRGMHFISLVLAAFEVYLHQILCVVLIGWAAGFQYLIFLFLVVVYLAPRGKGLLKFIIMFFGFINYALLDYFFKSADPIFSISTVALNLFNYGNIFAFTFCVGCACYLFTSKLYSTENEVKKEKINVERAYSLLSKYVAPQLADTISNGDVEQIWEHSRKKLTLFFSDIKDFTKLTDSLEPEDMASILNSYLTEMNLIINKYEGTLAQVIGDGLYVFFGAPKRTNDKDHAVRCLNMAIEMQSKMKELNKIWFELGLTQELTIRCGINTGMATVGGYGSSERKEYTAMGMQVNIAARLESACIPGKILINHTTWVLVKDDIPCLEKGKIEIKGYHLPLKIYEIQI